jgi:hypothetical protein
MFYFARLMRGLKKFFEILRNPSLRQEYQRAQAAVEYFLIFAVVAAIALLGVSVFYNKARTMATDFFTNTANAIMDEQAGTGCILENDSCSQGGSCCGGLKCDSNTLTCKACVNLNGTCQSGNDLCCAGLWCDSNTLTCQTQTCAGLTDICEVVDHIYGSQGAQPCCTGSCLYSYNTPQDDRVYTCQ